MAQVINFEVKELPKLYAVGKELRYSMEALMQGDNRIGPLWEKCFAENVFSTLEQQANKLYSNDYIGLMIDWDKGDGDFSYVCGMLFKEKPEVPEGHTLHEIEPTKAAVTFVKGKDTGDCCGNAHQMTEQALKEKGHTCDKMRWSMELYNCPRWTNPDENGEIILDYYIPID